MSIEAYKNQMAATVQRLGLNMDQWKNEDWKATWNGINQTVLNDAFEQHGLVRQIFSGLGEMEQRKCKNLARVEKKMTEHFPGRENFFKVVSDLVAVRIYCNTNQIAHAIDQIRKEVLERNGQSYVRGENEEKPYGFFHDKDKGFTDITQYLYVYDQAVGYPIEFQIGERFAAHTFTIDSALRDDKNCGKVDLWSDDFYGDVKNYILAKANSKEPTSKVALFEKAAKIHGGTIPSELQAILDQI